MDQSRCLQCVTGALTLHVLMGQPMQFLINERHQLIARSLIAITPGNKELGHRWRGCHADHALSGLMGVAKCCGLYITESLAAPNEPPGQGFHTMALEVSVPVLALVR